MGGRALHYVKVDADASSKCHTGQISPDHRRWSWLSYNKARIPAGPPRRLSASTRPSSWLRLRAQHSRGRTQHGPTWPLVTRLRLYHFLLKIADSISQRANDAQGTVACRVLICHYINKTTAWFVPQLPLPAGFVDSVTRRSKNNS